MTIVFWIFWVVIGICFLALFVFSVNELRRNYNLKALKGIFKNDNKDNINVLFGIDKKTFLALIANLMIASIALLALVISIQK